MRWRRRTRSHERAELALGGWQPGARSSEVDRLTDEDLQCLNSLLPWHSFTTDALGRRFGDRAWEGKRDVPEVIPDPRITSMASRFSVRGASVLEVGCFEGAHTIALCDEGAIVTAIDARVENIAKTAVRTAMYGVAPRLLVRDLDRDGALHGLEVDLVHHVGVLYHLEDPVRHLEELGAITRHGLMLDTHVASPDHAVETYETSSGIYRFQRYTEGGRADVFSGMTRHAKWLTTEGLTDALSSAGFGHIDIVEERSERNGRRVLLFADRAATGDSTDRT